MSDNNYNKPWTTYQNYRSPVPVSQLAESLIEDGKMTTQLFLYSVLQKKSISLPLIPDSLSEQYSPNVINKQAFGALHPVYFYADKEEKTLSFSLDIHEDMEMNGAPIGNLTKFLEKLNRFSYPKVVGGVVEGPETYIQLGRQFAGLGHIEVDFSYKKPFSRGRYKMASINLTFKFHELFDNLSTSVIKTEEELRLEDTYGQDLLVSVDSGDSIVDLYNQKVIEDYFKGQYDYIKEKVELLWSTSLTESNMRNIEWAYTEDYEYHLTAGGTKVDPESENFFGLLAEWYLNPPLDEDQADDYSAFLRETGYIYNEEVGYSNASAYSYSVMMSPINPFIVKLMRLLRHYHVILQMLGSMPYSAAVANLTTLKDRLVELSEDYKNPPAYYYELFEDRWDKQPTGDELLGVWTNEGNVYTNPSRLDELLIMTRDERRVFEQTIGGFVRLGRYGRRIPSYWNGLITTLDTFIENYEAFSGVGR